MTSRIMQDPGKGELGFPKLMEGRDGGGSVVVLFNTVHSGMVVYSNGGSPVGFFSTMWSFDERWKPFHGTVELRND